MPIQGDDINDNVQYNEGTVPKVTLCKTGALALDVYYMKPGQALGYHRHPQGDQIFTVIEGEGTFFLDEKGEETIQVKPGSVCLAPANVWHDLKNTGTGNLIAQQVTNQPAGMEKRDN